ncbi:hypothetical protein Hdeb2414_s0012g00384291 [Helianthus debilis subsp. tardiflorus]
MCKLYESIIVFLPYCLRKHLKNIKKLYTSFSLNKHFLFLLNLYTNTFSLYSISPSVLPAPPPISTTIITSLHRHDHLLPQPPSPLPAQSLQPHHNTITIHLHIVWV